MTNDQADVRVVFSGRDDDGMSLLVSGATDLPMFAISVGGEGPDDPIVSTGIPRAAVRDLIKAMTDFMEAFPLDEPGVIADPDGGPIRLAPFINELG